MSDSKSLATVHLTLPMQRMPRTMGVGRMARLESVRFKISCYSPFNITYAEDAEDNGGREDGEAGEGHAHSVRQAGQPGPRLHPFPSCQTRGCS